MFLQETSQHQNSNQEAESLVSAVNLFTESSRNAMFDGGLDPDELHPDLPLDENAWLFFRDLMKDNLVDNISKMRRKRWPPGTFSKIFKTKINGKGLRLQTLEFSHILTASDLGEPVEVCKKRAKEIKKAIKKGFERSMPPKTTRISADVNNEGDVKYTINLFTKRKYISDPDELRITANFIEELRNTVDLIMEEIQSVLS